MPRPSLGGVCSKCGSISLGNTIPKFCGKCGAAVLQACPQCKMSVRDFQEESPQFCEGCGKRLWEAAGIS
jgi:hypothetical protein